MSDTVLGSSGSVKSANVADNMSVCRGYLVRLNVRSDVFVRMLLSLT